MDETRRKAMRRAHARRANYCTCGKIVHGNGGKHAHRAMHERKGEWRTEGGHRYMTYSEYERRRDAALGTTKDLCIGTGGAP